MMEIPNIPLPFAFMLAIWRRADRCVADWFFPIRQSGGFITHEAKRDLTRNLPLVENNIRHLLRVLAEQAGIITPPPRPETNARPEDTSSAPSSPALTKQPIDPDLALARYMTRPVLFKLEAPKATPPKGRAPAAPRASSATEPSSLRQSPFADAPPIGSAHATPGMVERLAALIEVFMDVDTHILRMRKHLGKNPGIIRPRPHLTDTLRADLVQDCMALDLHHRRGIVPNANLPPP